jgi:hypothetical protein
MSAEHDKPKADKTAVNLEPEQYRSMILAKIRADIAAKQALYAEASVAGADDLKSLSYWKAGYWRMKYWKAFEIVDPVV